jgi:hypothetical protein
MACGLKLSFGPNGHHHSRSSPHPRVYTIPCASAILNTSWNLCSVRLFSTACDSASITSILLIWLPFSLSSVGETEKSRVDGDVSHVVFGQKFPGEKGSVRRRVVVIQQQTLLSPKFRAKSSHIFTQSPSVLTVVCGIDCLACQEEFAVNIPHDVRENESS